MSSVLDQVQNELGRGWSFGADEVANRVNRLSRAGKPKAIIFGDSITAIMSNFDPPPTTFQTLQYTARWFNVLQWRLKYPFIYNSTWDFSSNSLVGHNAGINGNTTSQMLDRLETDVLSKSPDVVFVMAGTNDIEGGVPAATVISNLTYIYDKIRASGAMVVAMPILPRRSPADWSSSDKRKNHLRVNTWIKEYADNQKGMIFVDTYTCAVDSSGDLTSGYTGDGLHPNQTLGWRMGDALYDQLQHFFFSGGSQGLSSPIDDYDAVLNPYGNLINGDFSGTGGTKTGAQVSGTVPDGFNVAQSGTPTSSCAVSKVARTDGKTGQAVRFALTATGSGGSASETFTMSLITAATPIELGAYYIAEVDWEVHAASAGAILNGIELRLHENSTVPTFIVGDSGGGWPDRESGILSFKTPPLKAVAGNPMSLSFVMKVDNTAASSVVNVDISRLKLRKLEYLPELN